MKLKVKDAEVYTEKRFDKLYEFINLKIALKPILKDKSRKVCALPSNYVYKNFVDQLYIKMLNFALIQNYRPYNYEFLDF